jgi:His-Xaa-Ser system radical SAM maturase HxsB
LLGSVAPHIEHVDEPSQASAAVPFNARRRRVGSGVLHVDDAGRFLLAGNELDARLVSGELSADDILLLRETGHLRLSALEQRAAAFARARRRCLPGALDYLILVPTLRCNLACSYCQVSRADLGAHGYDWSEQTLAAVRQLVGGLQARAVKIEFQGGEPTLRPDLIRAVIDAVPDGVNATFVICTNLQHVDDDVLALFDRGDVQISTSLDGAAEVHGRQRLGSTSADPFLGTLDRLLARYGHGKISALPTVDPASPPDVDGLIDAYASRGLNAIFLRPINYQGFARKRHGYARELEASWREYHERFIMRLIERNSADRSRVLEETYFSLLLRRIFRPGEDRHVDLRNPNPVGRDYVVIDFDGRAYPTDEARMLTRSGVIDLSIGDLVSGWDTPERAALDAASTNDGDPACEACVYRPFCGRDLVDDIARYGRIDLPRHETEFCRRHLHLFDLAFDLVHSADEAVRYSLRRWLGLAGDEVVLGVVR